MQQQQQAQQAQQQQPAAQQQQLLVSTPDSWDVDIAAERVKAARVWQQATTAIHAHGEGQRQLRTCVAVRAWAAAPSVRSCIHSSAWHTCPAAARSAPPQLAS
jgi:hypothetical protein